MRCPACDYSLWGASPPGPCPECGREFCTTEFIFAPGKVRFLCPSCGEAYQGTDYEGLPDPRVFACVTCGERVDADDMPAELAEGVAETDALVTSPWIRRKALGLRVAAHKTAVASLVNPSQIVQGVTDVRVGAAVKFAIIVWALVLAVVFLFLMVVVALTLFFTGGGGGLGATGVFFAVFAGLGVQMCIGAVLSLFIVVPIHALLAHGVLMVTGSRRAGLGTTLACMYYGQGPMILNILPICGWYVSGVWVWVSSIVLLKTAQQVSGWRAAIAVLFPAVGAVVLAVVAYGMFIMWALTAGAGFSSGQVMDTGPSNLASAMVSYTTETGSTPSHALDLLIDKRIDSSMLESSQAAGLAVLADGSLISALDTMAPEELTSLRDSLVDEEPLYKFGQLIFAHRMADLSAAPPDLWIAFSDPAAQVAASDPSFSWVSLEVHQANGRLAVVYGSWSEVVADQNIIRAAEGLAPIPTDITQLPQ